ncbi:hypothetical protein D9758_001217 [Tetrapyrgos nigripes]|uniref:HSF-type DNA-binding domain-containing protein n=1 Tax=Tetrapyrgos nigripes TaxID=182062 RepID=A0A8H5GRZ5_9AGAR|nr:hypothetical protein D9758_001217 [Tetrapyrgos nigripes]
MADLYPPSSYPRPTAYDDPHEDKSPKSESKPQATFLTKLYALLERPENHHMIRWDPQGEHIIVERPEQLALHVLPSIYRQSRFASFSRQLNIYGFMRKVNLRNVDPAIDDPDASTWSHPTLNRHSPPDVVANFKRRVPPRVPKQRKREQEQQLIPPPRSAIGVGPVSLSGPPSSLPPKIPGHVGRARGFSAPGSFSPQSGWGTPSYPRSSIPPLNVPSEPSHHMSYSHAPISPSDESTSSSYSGYHSYDSNSQWTSAPSSHNGSLSSLLNPSSNHHHDVYSHSSRPTPTINTAVHSTTSYNSPFSSMPLDHSASSLSPETHSRPATGYSMQYDDYGSRPNSSHRLSPPPRPGSAHKSSPYHNSGSLRIGRPRRHSQAMSPYPSPYDSGSSGSSLTEHQRPSTSPQPEHPMSHSSIPRARSMAQIDYSYQPDFAYSPLPSVPSISSIPSSSSISSLSSMHPHDYRGSSSTHGRPSTSTSSMSAASHTSSSQANTPPLDSYGHGDTEGMVRGYEPDFGFVPMNEHEHLQNGYAKEM